MRVLFRVPPRALPVRRLARRIVCRLRVPMRFIRRPRGWLHDSGDGPFATGVREPRRPRPPFMPPRAAAITPPVDSAG